VFPSTWISGAPNCGSEPPVQIHAYNQDFYILRQSLCTNFEAPFVYLIFGTDEVLMIDTGAGNVDMAGAVQSAMNAWSVATGNTPGDLTIVHTHGHGDHTAGDGQMMAQFPSAALVSANVNALETHFGIASWPTDIVPYDLGGRLIDIIPIPGHQSSHVAFYDRTTGILITGDSLYPGRLYIFGAQSQGNWTVYRASMQRLVDFTSNQPLCWVLGTHVEMTTTPGVDFALGSTSHPNEHRLQLERKHLIELNDAVQASATPVTETHDDFIITPIN
jgi:glyoxylase-like metal-dependent hydrolase (beta-lactamase superfamily II)